MFENKSAFKNANKTKMNLTGGQRMFSHMTNKAVKFVSGKFPCIRALAPIIMRRIQKQ